MTILSMTMNMIMLILKISCGGMPKKSCPNLYWNSHIKLDLFMRLAPLWICLSFTLEFTHGETFFWQHDGFKVVTKRFLCQKLSSFHWDTLDSTEHTGGCSGTPGLPLGVKPGPWTPLNSAPVANDPWTPSRQIIFCIIDFYTIISKKMIYSLI